MKEQDIDKHTSIYKEKKGMYRDIGFLTLDKHATEVVSLARRGLKQNTSN